MVSTRGSGGKVREVDVVIDNDSARKTDEKNTEQYPGASEGKDIKERTEGEDVIVLDDSTRKTPKTTSLPSPKRGKVNEGRSRKKTRAGRMRNMEEAGPALIQPKSTWKKDQKVNIFCKTKVLTILHQKMSDRQKKIMEDSFLWNLWDLPTTKFPTQLFLQIIRRRVHNDDKKVLTFNFEGHVVDFTMKDFAIITGLNCDDLKFTNLDKLPNSTIDRSFFKKHTTHCLKSLIGELEDYDFSNDKMSLKVAKLAMLESIVIPKQPTNVFEDLHLRMVEDDDVFEMYPWGRVSYDMLRLSISKAVGSCESQCMTVNGCAYALIYWAFEVIPALSASEKYGRRINHGEPRFLNWDVMRLGTCKELEKDVFHDQIVVTPLAPVEEVGKSYMAEFEKKSKNKGKNKLDDVMHQKEDLIEESEEDDEEIDVGESSSVKSDIKELKELVMSELASMKEKMNCIIDIFYMQKKRLDSLFNNEGARDPTEGDDSMKDGENDVEKNKYNEGERVEEEWMDSLVNSAINVGSMFDPLIGSVHAAGTGLYRQENELDGPSGEDAYLNPVADNVAPIVPVGDVEIRERSVPEDVVPKQDVIVNNIQVREAEEDVIVTEDVEDVVPKVLDDVVMGGEDKPNELNLTDKGHEECAASVEAAGGIVGQNVQRQPRNRKPSEKKKEPYTDEFGSAEPVMKKVPKKKRTKAGGKATGAKKMKVNSDIVNPAKDVDEAALRDENDPSFDIGLTPVLIELQGKKDDK